MIVCRSNDSIDKFKHDSLAMKSVNIKFGLPHGLKGFQKSFYENYIKEKAEKRESKITPSQYFSLQSQLKQYNPHSNHNKSEQELARQSIINRVMNRRNRLKKQHFLQDYLKTNKMV